MKKDLEPNPIELDVRMAENLVKEPMKATDPGKMDFTEDFFNRLHDKIMAQVELSEIRPKVPENPRSLPRLWRFWASKAATKSTPTLIAFALVLLTGVFSLNSTIQVSKIQKISRRT